MKPLACKHDPTGYCREPPENWDSCPCYGCEYFAESDEYKQEQQAWEEGQ